MPTLDEVIKTYGQIPSLESFHKPIFVGPHPDDIEFGCGGLISKYKELNIPVTYVIVTDGAAGSEDPKISTEMMAQTRKQEVLNAAQFMNVSNVEFLDLEDGGIFDIEDVIRRLAPIILKYQPDIIFAPDSRLQSECHGDHIKTEEAVRLITQIISHPQALKRHHVEIEGISEFPKNITLAMYFSDDANTKVEISEKNLQEKIQSILLHVSQTQDPSTELLLNYFQLKALKIGSQFASGLAEDYKVQVPLTQHVYSEGLHY